MHMALDHLSDEEIVKRVIAGDAALFELLMRRHNQRIYRAVRAILGADDEVEDAMQQAYLNAYQHLEQFAGEAQFSTWFIRIAVNEALGRRRTLRKVAGGEDDNVVLSFIPSPEPNPENVAAASELREVMEQEISALPGSFRSVLMMRDVEGLSTSETAACLDISEDLVKTRLHRARKMVRDNLYRRAGVSLASLFEFGNARCDVLVRRVMDVLSSRA